MISFLTHEFANGDSRFMRGRPIRASGAACRESISGDKDDGVAASNRSRHRVCEGLLARRRKLFLKKTGG